MPAAPNLGHAATLPPKSAVEYFRSLGYKVTDDWLETAEAVRGKAFAAAKSGSLDILKDLKEGLIHAAESGEPEASFVERMGATLRAKGWDPNNPSRLRTIFRTNMQSAYMAGRWTQFQASRNSHPYLKYIAVMDARTRPSHAAMNGLVFHIDDPIWKTHYPPCGYNCRCRVSAISGGAVKRQNITVRSSAGDRFSEEVVLGDGQIAEVHGYRTPLQPRRVAQRDSAPGALPKVEKGDVLLWDPADDPKWAEGEGPPWAVEARRVAMRTDPGFGFNQGRWDGFSSVPGEPPARGNARVLPGQPTWQDAGRPDLRDVQQRPAAPPLLPGGKSKKEALKTLADTLLVSEDHPLRTLKTPVELVRVDYNKLGHLVEKRDEARERYGLFLLATLAKPFEVYLTEYDDGTFRTRYIGLFDGPKQLLVVGLVNRDGTVLWNVMQSSAKRLNEQRVGTLLHAQP